MERALLQGERESELLRLRQEQEAVQQLQEKLSTLDASIRKERDKVSPVTGSHCHQLCHALPGTASQCCNASCCSIRLRTCSPDPGLHRGFGEQPLWFALWWDLSVCLPGVGQTALLEEGRANAQEAFWLLPVALAGSLWCEPFWMAAACSGQCRSRGLGTPHYLSLLGNCVLQQVTSLCCTFVCDGSCCCSVRFSGSGWGTTAGV